MSVALPAKTRVTQHIVMALLIAAYATWNVVAWRGQPAIETFDSYRYVSPGDFNLMAIFEPLNGGFATSLLYALASEPTAISLLQVLIAVTAWSLLALAIVHRLTGSWIGWLLAVLVLLISMQSVFWSSHFALASESLAFSATVAWLASIVWLTSRHGSGTGAIVAVTLGMALMAATRPQAMLTLIPVQLVVLMWWARRESRPRALIPSVAALVPIAAFALYRVWQVSQHDRWPFRYALHNLVDKEPSFRAYALERMPPCEAIPAALGGPSPWNDVLALDNTMINVCPDTYLWFQSGATSVWNWVPAIPGATLQNFIDILPTLTLIRWNDISAWPAQLDAALMPALNPWIFLIGCLALGIVLAWLAGVRPRITMLGTLGVLIASASAASYVFLVWAADGVDHGRHVLPVLPLVGIAALVLPSVIPARRASNINSSA